MPINQNPNPTPAPIAYVPNDGDTIVLKSQSGDYSLNWKQLKALVGSGGSGGSVSPATYVYVTQTGNYTIPDYTSQELAVDGTSKNYVINGNGLNQLIVNPNWISGNGNPLDNSKTNFVLTQSIGGKVIYSVEYTTLADTTIPSFLANSVGSITSNTATYNTQISETGIVKWIVTTSSVAPSKAAILAGTGAIGSNYGSISTTGTIATTVNLTSLTASTTYYLYSYAIDAAGNESTIQSPISFATQDASAYLATDDFTGVNTGTISGRSTITGSRTWLKDITATGNAGIVSNKLKMSTIGYDVVTVPTTSNNVDFEVTLSTTSAEVYAIICYTSETSYIDINLHNKRIVQRGSVGTAIIASVTSDLSSSGDVMRVTRVGNLITLYRNGVSVQTATLTISVPGQRIGFSLGDTIGEVDNFKTVY